MQVFGNSGAAWVAAMRRGDWAAAWALGDAALAARDPATRDDPGLPYHLRWVWDGTPLDGRRVLVRCYHGLGDTIQFARFLPALRARAAHVTLEVQAPLRPLLQAAADRAVPFDAASPLPPAEVDVEVMELSQALRLPPEGLAAPLCPRSTIGHGGIALCWQAGDWDRRRSVPLGALLGALAGCRDTGLVSLQRGAAAAQARGKLFRNPGDDDGAIRRTAALIGGARCVVTVDTMVAHLAGTLAAPAIVLLPYDADWRWGSGTRTPWYPSLRLLRQHAPGDWSQPLAALPGMIP